MIDLNKIVNNFPKELAPKGLKAGQITGLNKILSHYNLYVPEMIDLRQLAYVLATAYHETAFTFQPVKEAGSNQYLSEMYDPILGKSDKRKRMALANGNTEEGDGVMYAGKGYVQLTWKTNYERFEKLLKLDLVNKPELALDPDVACKIMFIGMTKGMFTGKKLSDYFGPKKENWNGARAIINGEDKAERIAGYAKLFYEMLKTCVTE